MTSGPKESQKWKKWPSAYFLKITCLGGNMHLVIFFIFGILWVQESSKSAQNTIKVFSNINLNFSRFRIFFEKNFSRPDFSKIVIKQKKAVFFCYFFVWKTWKTWKTDFFCFPTIFEKSGLEIFFSKKIRNLEKFNFMLENTFMVFWADLDDF